MKNYFLFLSVFASINISAQTVEKGDWIKIASSVFADTYISKKSILINKDEVVAWTKYEFSEPIKPNSKTRPLWKENTLSAFASNRSFDCKKISSSLNKSGMYNEKNEFLSIDENEKPQFEKTLAAPDSPIYEEINRICDFVKNGKVSNKGWELVPYERYKVYKDQLDEQRSLIKKENEDGVYGEKGLLSEAALKRFGSIFNLEEKIESLASNNNIHALEYVVAKFLNACTINQNDEDFKFTSNKSCMQARAYLSMLAPKGRVSYKLTLISINTIYFPNQTDHVESLKQLKSIDFSKLNSNDRSSYEWITDLVKKKIDKN